MKKYYIFFIFLSVGFLIGRYSDHLISKTITKTETTKKQEISQVREVSNNQKDSTTVKQTTRKEIYYSPKGKLTKIVIVDNNLSKKESVNNLTHTLTQKSSKEESTKKTSQSQNALKDWLVGFSVPSCPLIHSSPDINWHDVQIQAGYRIIGGIYLTATSDIQFQKPKVGVLMNF